MAYRDSFDQNTVFDPFVNDESDTAPAFACVPFTFSLDGRTGRKPTRLDEAEQDWGRIGFAGQLATKAGKSGKLTQHWPAVASVPKSFGPVDVGARLGPVADQWELGWGTAFFAAGMVENSEQLLWVYPSYGDGYSGPGFQTQDTSQTVASGEQVTFGGSPYTITALSARDVRTATRHNFAESLVLGTAPVASGGGSELLIPRRGRYLVAFNGMATSPTGITGYTDLSFRWRIRVDSTHYLTALMGYGRTRLEAAEDGYTASRQTRTMIGISGTIPLRHSWSLSLQNTSNVAVTLENFTVSVLHVGPVSQFNVCPWGEALWV